MSPAGLLRSLALLGLAIGWAFLAHFGSTAENYPDFSAALATAPLAAIAVILLWRVRNPLLLVSGGLAVFSLLAWSWPYLRQNVALLYFIQHLGINLALGTLFGRSLIGSGPALVTHFALLAHNGSISPAQLRYTRQVTVAWAAYFFLTATLSAGLFWLAPPSAWSIFANLLTAPLIVLMFGIEHLVRHRVLPPQDRTSIADTIRGYRASRTQTAGGRVKHP